VSSTWCSWVQGSPVFIWEQKIKNVKKVLRDRIIIKDMKEKHADRELVRRMEESRIKMETAPISSSRLWEEQQTFIEYQNVLRDEEETWRLK
jgi:hypothetical protein